MAGIDEPLLKGDIYWVNLDPIVGREIGKKRPAVIIQNNTGNRHSPVTIIAPLSSTKEITKPLPIMVFLKRGEAGFEDDGYIDCGQIRTVDKARRIVKKIGRLSPQRIKEMNDALRISLDLN